MDIEDEVNRRITATLVQPDITDEEVRDRLTAIATAIKELDDTASSIAATLERIAWLVEGNV